MTGKRALRKALVRSVTVLLPAVQWIGTGAIMCAEGGGHHRPNRHAELSREIFRSLELVISNRAADPLEQLVARRMHPKCAHALALGP